MCHTTGLIKFYWSKRTLNIIDTSYFTAVLGSQQKWAEGTNFLYTPCPHTCIVAFTTNVSNQSSTFVTVELHRHIIITQSPWFTLGFSWCCMDLDKYIMTCIHYYSIIQGIFTTLISLCATYSSFPMPNSCNPWSFNCLHRLPFLEHHIGWIIWYVAFSDWLFFFFTHCILFLQEINKLTPNIVNGWPQQKQQWLQIPNKKHTHTMS